jgi:hypothetical protein
MAQTYLEPPILKKQSHHNRIIDRCREGEAEGGADFGRIAEAIGCRIFRMTSTNVAVR